MTRYHILTKNTGNKEVTHVTSVVREYGDTSDICKYKKGTDTNFLSFL